MFFYTHAFYLQIGQTKVERFIGIGIPDQPYIGHHKVTQISLVAGQIPDTRRLAVNLLIRQYD